MYVHVRHAAIATITALALGIAGTRIARAQTCTPLNPTGSQIVISAPGVYCLTGDLVTSSSSTHAIHITADGVVLDLNGHHVYSLVGAVDSNQAWGIYFTQKNIQIKNGRISGFSIGVYGGFRSAFSMVENLIVSGNRFGGIHLNHTHGAIVRNNHVEAIGPNSGCGWAYGIMVEGSNGAAITNNDVKDIKACSSSIPSDGIATSGLDVVIEGNRVRGTGTNDYGIHLYAGSALVVNNRITHVNGGVYFGSGTTGKYRDNLVLDVPNPYLGGIDAGGNN
jgi:parallel beta-helix repeat protein